MTRDQIKARLKELACWCGSIRSRLGSGVRNSRGTGTLPGYDAWRLRGPDEPSGPTCDYCGTDKGVRVAHRGWGGVKDSLICEDCFTGADDGPCFDDLQLAAEYYEDMADERADRELERRRDSRFND